MHFITNNLFSSSNSCVYWYSLRGHQCVKLNNKQIYKQLLNYVLLGVFQDFETAS